MTAYSWGRWMQGDDRDVLDNLLEGSGCRDLAEYLGTDHENLVDALEERLIWARAAVEVEPTQNEARLLVENAERLRATAREMQVDLLFQSTEQWVGPLAPSEDSLAPSEEDTAEVDFTGSGLSLPWDTVPANVPGKRAETAASPTAATMTPEVEPMVMEGSRRPRERWLAWSVIGLYVLAGAAVVICAVALIMLLREPPSSPPMEAKFVEEMEVPSVEATVGTSEKPPAEQAGREASAKEEELMSTTPAAGEEAATTTEAPAAAEPRAAGRSRGSLPGRRMKASPAPRPAPAPEPVVEQPSPSQPQSAAEEPPALSPGSDLIDPWAD